MAKRLISFILLIIIVLPICSCQNNINNEFESWDTNSVSLETLRTYVDEVTNEKSDNFVPKQDRIAVFDMDGTLYGEKAPIYIEWIIFAYRVLDDITYKDKASEEEISVAKKIREAGESGVIPKELEEEEWIHGAKVFSNMTLDEYSEYVTDFLERDAKGFEQLKYKDMWYKPMLEVIKYLQKRDFNVYICSGTDRTICRIMVSQVLDIPMSNIIGSDIHYMVEGQDGKNQIAYQYEEGNKIVRTDNPICKDVKFSKVESIINSIGQKPILSFGNSSGDISMSNFVIKNNTYKSMAFMVVADDNEREFADMEKANQAYTEWGKRGYVTFSMKDDFKKIYKDNLGKSATK